VKECLAALRQPMPSESGPRAKLRSGFETSIDALRKELTSMLGEVADLDNDGVQDIDNLATKAADMWLEIGIQPFRVLVVLKGSNLKSAKERIQRAREGTLGLVVAPELRRFGDSKGLAIDIEETVGGCDGKTVEVSIGNDSVTKPN
jgi:hypothetical protein